MTEEKAATAGRPTSYNEDMLAQSLEYLERFIDATPEELKDSKEVIPTVVGLAIFLGVARSTIYLWGKENPVFSDILEEVLAVQESLLINNGLKGAFTPVITKLMLTKHGYSDKQEVDNISSNGSMTPKSPFNKEQLIEVVKELREEI